MKRFLTLLFTALLMTAALCVGASASSFDGAAEELSAIGVFRGTASGFQLDQAPTRAQAAIMLVRLYGAEEEAKAAYDAGELTCAFTDVNETAAPYVAWLADKGLANGTAPDTFGAANPCTAKAYTIFLLRALGYQDNVDFTTASAQDFAASKGLLDLSSLTGTFLRDDLAALTYQALGSDLKDGSTYLLDSLIKNGAVDAGAAKPITEKIETYRALTASSADAAQGFDAAIDAKMGMRVSLQGQADGTALNELEKMDASIKGTMQAVLDQDIQIAMDLTVTMNDGETEETEQVGYWFKDGTMYIRTGDTFSQMPVEMDMDALSALMEQASGASGASMLPLIGSITAKTSGEDTVYTLTLNNAFSGLLNGILSQVLGEVPVDVAMDMAFSLDKGAFTYTVGKDGALKSAAAVMTMKMDVNAAQGADSAAVSVVVDMDMTMDVKAMGKDVKITFPDFSDFLQ